MRLTRDEMLKALAESDATFNGRFVTGVLTTGIYCLPSCRARKPKPENVRFFDTFAAAREFGLRACKKCRPDAFETGLGDQELLALEAVVAKLRANPADFRRVESLAEALGVGETKLFSLIRRHYHQTPARLMSRAKVDRAAELLQTSDAAVAEIAFEVGFESLSVFYEHFREWTGMTPTAYRAIPEQDHFELALPTPYRPETLLRYAGRDSESLHERVTAEGAQFATWLGQEPVVLTFAFDGDRVRVTRTGGDGYLAHANAVRILGFDQDAAGFASHLRRIGFPALVEGCEGLRVPQTATVFDAVVWAIVGQQITVSFAATLRRRLAEGWAVPASEGLRAPLRPVDLAGVTPDELLPLQISTRKAEYLLGLAAEMPNLAGLSATRTRETLLALRGIGPWAANYLMIRGLGWGDCAPLGDTGLLAGLRRLFGPEVTQKDVAALMETFSPHQSLATLHLWFGLSKEG